MKTVLLHSSAASVISASELLSQDEVVALPTETVYGLAGNAFSHSAVAKIFSAKERPTFDPLIVHVSEKYLAHPLGIVHGLIESEILMKDAFDQGAITLIENLMRKYWPGPLTLVLPRGKKIPDLVTAGHSTVGIRCPSHPLFQQVLAQLSFPLAAPSANRFGRISPTEAKDVIQELDGRIPAVLDGGQCEVGLESTIIQIKTNPLAIVLLRPGKISLGELALESAMPIQTSAGLMEQNQNALAPGMLDEHYAPKKPLFLLNRPLAEYTLQQLNELLPAETCEASALLSMGPLPQLFDRKHFLEIRELSLQNNTTEMAQKLYLSMRALDLNPEVQSIIADVPEPGQTLSAAIRDRLKRASRNKPLL